MGHGDRCRVSVYIFFTKNVCHSPGFCERIEMRCWVVQSGSVFLASGSEALDSGRDGCRADTVQVAVPAGFWGTTLLCGALSASKGALWDRAELSASFLSAPTSQRLSPAALGVSARQTRRAVTCQGADHPDTFLSGWRRFYWKGPFYWALSIGSAKRHSRNSPRSPRMFLQIHFPARGEGPITPSPSSQEPLPPSGPGNRREVTADCGAAGGV